jgi:HAD superfamily phosphoserine phosphatase-like hydrolase
MVSTWSKMKSVFLFDFDGTISKKEMLPLIAKNTNSIAEISRLTEDTIQGKITFKESFLKRVKLLEQIPLEIIQSIFLEAPVNLKLLSWIKEHRELCFVVTGQLDIWIKPWLEKHELIGFYSEASVTTEGIKVNKIIDKGAVISNFVGREVVMVGDGANDVSLMEKANISIGTEIVHKVPAMVWEVADLVVWEEDALCRILSRLL